jgi:hypothetical protein
MKLSPVIVSTLSIASSPISALAATTSTCQPGGGEVTADDCLTALHALLLNQQQCDGKAIITESTITANHGSCCAAMYFDAQNNSGKPTPSHSIDYRGAEFAKGIVKCSRGAVYLDTGVVFPHNQESCRGTYVGKRAQGARLSPLAID